MSNLNRKMAAGALWMALLRLSVNSLRLISTVILARLLVPADFGVIAMATSIIAFLELATAFSFDIPLIQKQDASREHYDTAWTLNLLLYAALTLILIILAKPAALFYQEDRVAAVIYVLAVSFLFKGFSNIGVVNFRKELNFRKDFMLMFGRKFAGFIVAIPLAFYLRSYWALVLGMVIGDLLGVILTYALHPYRPKLSLSSYGEIMGFSKWLLLNNIVGFFQIRSSAFVIGRISGSSALGVFELAFQISTLPTTELVAPINRAVFPGYSKIAGNTKLLRKSYFDVLAIIAFVAIPASFGISAVSTQLVDFVLGSKWHEAAPIIAILAFYGGINAIQTNSGSVFIAIGKPHLIALLGAVNVSILLGFAIPLGYKFGAMGVAVALLISVSINTPMTFFFACKSISAPVTNVVRVLWRPAVSSAGMYCCIAYLERILASNTTIASGAMLFVLVVTGVLVYTTFSLTLWWLSGKPASAEYRLVLATLEKIRRQEARANT